MSVLTSAPHSFVPGNPVSAKVRTNNARGDSDDSPLSNVNIVAQVAPPSGPPNFRTTSNANGDVTLGWDTMSAAEYGHSPVTDYILSYTSETTHTTAVVITLTDHAATSYTWTNLTPANENFIFRIKAKNIHGEGVEVGTTPALTLLSGSAPAAPTKPTVTESGTSVVMSWSLPSKNNGAAVESYKIFIKDASPNATYTDRTTDCAGRTDPLSTTCSIAMSTIRAYPDIVAGEGIFAQVAAVNAIGPSANSPSSTEAVSVKETPSGVVTSVDFTSTIDSIKMSWTGLTDNTAESGYGVITSYVTTYQNTDAGKTADNGSREVLISEGNNVTFGSLTTGDTYNLTIAAKSIHGTSTNIFDGTFIAAGKPATPTAPTITQDDKEVVITWTNYSPSNGLPIDSYHILLTDGANTPAYAENTTL